MRWGRVYAAIQRHLWQFWAGEDDDEESGMQHLAHAAWGCFTLMDYTAEHPELDDRVKVPSDQLKAVIKEEIAEVDLGDPGNPYKRKRMKGKWYWTWGFHLPWYVGTADEPPERLKRIVRAIHAAGKKRRDD